MHRLFGKAKPKVEAPTLGDASGAISTRVTDLDKKINDLDNELKKYKDQLKKTTGSANANIKKRAMDCLKRKRMYEQQRDQMTNQQFNIDQTSFAIETVKNTQVTVAAMTAAAKTLKVEQKKINLNDLENMQDDMEDLLEDVGEISDILGRSYGCPDGIEEEDLDAELACLEDDWAAEEISESTSAIAQDTPQAAPYLSSMPSQPTAAPNVFTTAQATATAAPQYNSLV